MVDLQTFRNCDIKAGEPNSVAADPRGYHAYAVDSDAAGKGLHIIDLRDRSNRSVKAEPLLLIAVFSTTELVFVPIGGDKSGL
jgi:hypothetical protein